MKDQGPRPRFSLVKAMDTLLLAGILYQLGCWILVALPADSQTRPLLAFERMK
jgi:hypothetical protein